MKNVKLNYLFRDEANYKNFGYIIFQNPNNVPLKFIELTIQFYLIDGVFFYPERWDLPRLAFEGCGNMWHEFESLELTTEQHTTEISIEKFLAKCCR